MSTTSAPTRTAATAEIQPSLRFFQELTKGYSPRDFAVRFWNGWVWEPEGDQEARCTLVLKHPGAVRRMFSAPNKAAFGEAYIFDDFDIEGDVLPLFRWIRYAQKLRLGPVDFLHKALLLWQTPGGGPPREDHYAAHVSGAKHSHARDEKAVQYHYDRSSSRFYENFLDERHMLYTCAYFADPNEDIETAQTRKLEHVCRKLRLQPGERLIDFGCGWGGFILYAAKHYGVHATGITISKEQAAWVERRIREEGLQDRVTLRFGDYRDAPEDKPFDKASSIGLVEHLGARKVRPFFDKIRRLLKPNGLYLHHGITLKPYTPYPAWRAFTLKYVFPDGELVPINTTIDHLSAAGFEVRDVESLREHYMYTLERWLRKLESNADAVRDLTDDVTYRIYRIYLAGALHGFQWGVYNLYQTLAVNAVEGVTGLPLTRKDWYR